MQQNLKAIREELRFSIGVFSTILGLKKATYQCYENGSRAVPKQVMISAQEQLQRTRDYWAGMDARIDARLSGGHCLNEIRRNI